jgi:hypothetical protein
MEIYLNRIDGIDDAICTMFLSKRHLTRKKEMEIRNEVRKYSVSFYDGKTPLGAIGPYYSEKLAAWLHKTLEIGVEHMTLLRFIDLSCSVYGLHRGGQDDFDAHAMRLNNRIVRASTRLGEFKSGEMSEWYQGRIVPTDVALAVLGITMPDELTYEGKTYVRAVNGYILKGEEHNHDAMRGLYMLSIPSDFIFRIQLVEYSHVYKMRNKYGTAAPELKLAIENVTDQLEAATQGLVTRELLLEIPN